MVVDTCHRSLVVLIVIVGGIEERDGGGERKVRVKKVEVLFEQVEFV